MGKFLSECIFWCFICLCGIIAGCAWCSPLKGVGDENEYNDIKDEQ